MCINFLNLEGITSKLRIELLKYTCHLTKFTYPQPCNFLPTTDYGIHPSVYPLNGEAHFTWAWILDSTLYGKQSCGAQSETVPASGSEKENAFSMFMFCMWLFLGETNVIVSSLHSCSSRRWKNFSMNQCYFHDFFSMALKRQSGYGFLIGNLSWS